MDLQTEKNWSFETNVYVTLLREEIEELKEQLEKERELRKELLPIAEHCVQLFEWEGRIKVEPYAKYKSAIERAKKAIL